MPEDLVDSHVHLDRYSHRQVSSMLRRARLAGVTRFLTVGVDLPSSEVAMMLTRRRGVRAAVGIHPTRLHQMSPDSALSSLADLVRGARPAAIGEVGLDHRAIVAADEQARFLAGCLRLAARHSLPVILHVVGAHDAALAILAEAARMRRPSPLVVHYFVGDGLLARRYLDLGCLISVGKPVTRQEHGELRSAVAETPLDRLLLETDTYPLPGRTTEPRDVRDVCAAVAEIKRRSVEEVAAATTKSFLGLFARSTRRPRRTAHSNLSVPGARARR
jgi:TatD DNase family protein